MTIRVIYEGGVFRPLEHVELPEHSEASVVVLSAKPPARDIEGASWDELRPFRGQLAGWPMDPVEWQRRMRDEDWS